MINLKIIVMMKQSKFLKNIDEKIQQNFFIINLLTFMTFFNVVQTLFVNHVSRFTFCYLNVFLILI